MSLLTLDVPDEVLALATTPEGMVRARAAVLAAFGIEPQEATPLIVSEELYGSFIEIIDGVEAGTIKTKPFDAEATMARGLELLRQVKR